MNKKIIGILSAVTLLGGAVYLSGQGGFGALSSSVLGGDACTQAGLDAQKAQYEGSSDQIASLEEQMSSLEDSISSAEESIATYQTNVANKKQEIKNTNQEVNQLENYIRSQCGVKKQTRGGQVNYSAPDCNPKKNQVANKKQQINNLEKSVKDANNAIQAAQGNIQNQTSSLQQLENNIAEIEEFVEEYDGCEMTLASGSGGDVEVGIDTETLNLDTNVSITNPEIGSDLLDQIQNNESTDTNLISGTSSSEEFNKLIGTIGETACNQTNIKIRESEFFDIYRKLTSYSKGATGSASGVGYTVYGNIQSLKNQIKDTEKKIKNLKKSVDKLEQKHTLIVKMSRQNNGGCYESNYNNQKCPKPGEINQIKNSLDKTKNDLDFQKNAYLPGLKRALIAAQNMQVEINTYQAKYEEYKLSYQKCLEYLDIPLQGSRICGTGSYTNSCLMAN